MRKRFHLVGLWAALCGGPVAAPVVPVDPCFPVAAAPEASAPALAWWLPKRIRQLEEERERILGKIGGLPHHNPLPLPDHLGYHSLPADSAPEADEPAATIDFTFDFDTQLDSIALVPAFVPGQPGAYAFPKRFRIDVLESGGRWVGGKGGRWVHDEKSRKWTEAVNWLDEDFPDPGPYPVFFAWTGRPVYCVRLAIPNQPPEMGAAFHALGEIYLFRRKSSGGIGDNMAVWGDTVEVKAAGSLSKPPLWDARYLYDGVVGLGMPLSEETTEAEDLMVAWPRGDGPETPVRILLDLGQVRQVGRVQLWPAEAPHGMAIPRFGFPGKVVVELSADPGFAAPKRVEVENPHDRMHHNNLLNVITGAYKARYVRLTLSGFRVYRGRSILGLGEIRVAEYDDVWSLHCPVSADGLPPDGLTQLPRLVDGCSRHRRILRESEWIKGLALRRPLDARLAIVGQELEQARNTWNGFKLRASIWGGGLLCAGLLGAMALQRLQRRKVLKKLKFRITRDLHDEVGSSLGGITLAARRMEDSGASRRDLAELSLMAREASASLRDVVWVIDQATIRLPELLKKLAERAERVLGGVELAVDLPADCPNLAVPLTFKRHLLMFFKEAVHNCARHSGATAVRIRISTDHGTLALSLEDNGCGFDPHAKPGGWGVDSMGKRAKELGGEMELQTAIGKGTKIVLTVPLSALHNGTDHSYQTSN